MLDRIQNGIVRIADLPTTRDIDPMSFMIVEKPGFNEGTFKATVEDLQNAITVKAKVEQVDMTTTIEVDDINGHTEASIVTPTAKIIDNGDNTYTIVITDTDGTTQTTGVSKIILDTVPTEGSPNFLNSGSLYDAFQREGQDLEELNRKIEETRLALNNVSAKVSNLLAVSDIVLTTQEDIEVEFPFESSGHVYSCLADAIASVEPGQTISLITNAHDDPTTVPEGKDFELDLNGHILTIVGSGSAGIEFAKDSIVIVKDGQITFDSDFQTGIQNYCNLTLDDVKIYGENTLPSVLSAGCGNIILKNNTLLSKVDRTTALSVIYGSAYEYDSGVNVIVEDNSVRIDGKVEFGKTFRVPASMFRDNASITCSTSMSLDITVLTPPCSWTDNGDGTKTFRYSGSD